MPIACRYHYRSCYINCTGPGIRCNFFRKHLTRYTEKGALLKRNTQERKKLEREIQRKEKAFAEAAALLVLSKKANAIWGDPEDEK